MTEPWTSVGFAFDAVGVRAVSLDHSRVGAVPSFGIGPVDDFVDGFGDCGGESVRGKNPPGWEPGGASYRLALRVSSMRVAVGGSHLAPSNVASSQNLLCCAVRQPIRFTGQPLGEPLLLLLLARTISVRPCRPNGSRARRLV